MIMSEPVAAALAFGLGAAQTEGRRVLVFDLGGGTFDISIIQMRGDQFQVLYHGGNNWLGGDDFDKEIITAIAAHVQAERGFDPSDQQDFRARAKQEAQKAKMALGASDEYEIIMNPAGTSPDGSLFSVDMIITREEFEQMITKYVDECMELTREALRNQELTEEDISDILLVGGSTAVPLIQRRLRQLFQRTTIRSDIEPMECVALGASIMAAKLKGVECPACYEDKAQKLHTINDESATVCQKCGASLANAHAASALGYHDVTAMHLGIRAVKGDNLDAFIPIIPKGTHYPLTQPIPQTFYTTEENQHLIKVPVFEGLHDLASQNEQQGIVEWNLPAGLVINTPVEVAFNFDRDRVLTVNLRVMGKNDLAHEVVLKRGRPQEIIKTTEQEEVDWREETEGIIPAAEQFLQYFGAYTKEGTAEKMHNDLEKLRGALDEDNETRGRAAAHSLYLAMFGGAGIASQLYLAQRASEGAPPEVAADILSAAEELRNAHDSNADARSLRDLVGQLKTKITRQLQARLSQEVVGDKIDYEQLLRFKQ
jgi:molecular chaperone DnaK (HSP70)